MKTVMSVRLAPKQVRRLRSLAKKQGKELSTVARELVESGWVYVMLREYRAGKVSLGTLANSLGVPLADVLDLLAELGVQSPIEYDDYLRGYDALASVKKARRKA